MKFRTLGVVSSFALAAALATPAFAQDVATSTEGRQTAQQDEGRNADIVVTAEFREARLQDTPIAITAVNAEMLEARGQTDLSQVAAQAPNVTLRPQGTGGGTGLIAYIRGVGQTDFIFAREPGVGIYVDDVYIPTLSSSLIELLDLERVEILRGPQGTLAGRNSIGGSIKLFGKKPVGDGSGSVEVSYGSFNDTRIRGHADFALSDNLNARISGLGRNVDGYVKMVDYGLTHPTSNVPANQSIGNFPELGTMGGQSTVAGRLALDWQPTERLNVYVTGDYTNQDGDTVADVLIAAGPPGAAFDGTGQNPAVDTAGSGTPWLAGINGDAVTVGCQFVPFGPYSCDTPPAGYDPKYITYANFLDAMAPTPTAPYKPYYAVPRNSFNGWGVQGTITYDVSDAAQLIWIQSYRKYKTTWAFDQDGTPVPVAQLNNIMHHHAWTEEARFNFGLGDGLFEGTLGAYYLKMNGDYEARVDLNYVAAPTPIDFIHGPDTTPASSKAAFFNGTLHPTDALTLSAGLRYTKEKKGYTYFRRNPDYTPPDAATCFANLPSISGFFDTSNCPLVGFLGFTPPAFKGHRWDWRVVADYRISDALLVYASAATGFKGGGINPRPFVPDQSKAFNPETLTTYEVGFKSDFLDRRVRLNGAAFFNKYKDVQGTILVCPESSLPFPCLRPANVGAADVKGFELEASVYPVDGLSLDASVAYLDFEYTSATEPGPGGPVLVGTSIPETAIAPYTPELTYSFGIQYDAELGGGTFSTRFDGNYVSHIYTTSENTPFSRVDGYFLANGRLTYTTRDDDWKVSLEVKNIFDKYYYLGIADASLSLGTVNGAPGLPRTWLVTIKRNFH